MGNAGATLLRVVSAAALLGRTSVGFVCLLEDLLHLVPAASAVQDVACSLYMIRQQLQNIAALIETHGSEYLIPLSKKIYKTPKAAISLLQSNDLSHLICIEGW